ncbi:MAG: hypothetical protein OEZ29_03485 [Candidatus Bathyarchaeota archaeon]|nr:hypothetical protein [Candidatus Bathyarchaeota archaeon]MDH5779636.1 hypothetical protein [Candidatus Bathyarchaeota archaeon]
MGLFNPNAPLTADLNLLFQIAIFIFLVVGVSIAKFRRKFIQHGTTMAIALVLNTISIAVVMIPSLQGFRGVLSMPFTRPAFIIVVHAAAGTLVELLGVWLVGTWAFQYPDIKACAKKRSIMLATIFLWLVELLLGIYVYIMLYLPI